MWTLYFAGGLGSCTVVGVLAGWAGEGPAVQGVWMAVGLVVGLGMTWSVHESYTTRVCCAFCALCVAGVSAANPV